LTILISWKWNHIYCNPEDVSYWVKDTSFLNKQRRRKKN